ncbi:hypothetical protein MH17539M_46440 [Enterobacter hormaechei]|nr:hypothetical protein MH17539M_46440 [Enterobacter hormaechei]DAL14976.1 MAG TPA_asm: hypothetical protein [Caudoviricetes sp.]DAO63664.1 MAG TPA: hypothetical protein [Caudoviricetes sp.]
MTCVILLSSASGRFKNFLALIAAAEKVALSRYKLSSGSHEH